MKAAMDRIGFYGQNPRKPLLPLNDDQKKELDILLVQTKNQLIKQFEV